MTQKDRFPDWEEKYKTEPVEAMGWFYEDLDPDLALALQELNLKECSCLDLGTGPGTQAIGLARLGFNVTASDISLSAIEKAVKKAGSSAQKISFIQDDILKTSITDKFCFIFDRGCFHVFSPEKRSVYLRHIKKLIKKNGYLFLKCFSSLETSDKGPYKFTKEDIERVFSRDFQVTSVDESVYYGTLKPLPKALFCVLKKR